MLSTICKISILVLSTSLVLSPLSPVPLEYLTFSAGALVLLSNLPRLSGSYQKPVYVFLILSYILFAKYNIPFQALVAGVNSMTGIVAMVAVLQLFVIPIKMGSYDRALQQFLQTTYKKESSLYIFLNLITHLLGSFMLFGTVPMLHSIFNEPLKNMVHNPKRFTVTAMSRGFALVTLWAPGAINVILALQATGAKWLHVSLPAIFLALLGLVTAIFLEVKTQLKDNSLIKTDPAGSEGDNASLEKEDKRKIFTLILIAVSLILLIVLMEAAQVLTGTVRVLVAGLIVLVCWLVRYLNKPGLYQAWRGYWEKSITVVPDLAALFLSMGIFTEIVQHAGLMEYVKVVLTGGISLLGQYTFLLIPPVMILLSLIGIHPFISIMLIGKILVAAIQMPHYEVFIALSLLIGGVISYVVSPFAGNVLTLAKLTNCSPKEVAFKWNGLFAVVFLLEGLVFLLILQMVWR